MMKEKLVSLLLHCREELHHPNEGTVWVRRAYPSGWYKRSTPTALCHSPSPPDDGGIQEQMTPMQQWRTPQLLLWYVLCLVGLVEGKLVTFSNTGFPLVDINGQPMDVHDGTIQRFNLTGPYYMHAVTYGLCRAPLPHGCDVSADHCGFRLDHNISVWTSWDLSNGSWVQMAASAIDMQERPPGTVFRPSVVYNGHRQEYTMWWNYVHPNGTYAGFAAATSPRPEGPFTLQTPQVNITYQNDTIQAGDFHLFVDHDGEGYVVYSAAFYITVERLTHDYLATRGGGGPDNMFDGFRGNTQEYGFEAPVLFRRRPGPLPSSSSPPPPMGLLQEGEGDSMSATTARRHLLPSSSSSSSPAAVLQEEEEGGDDGGGGGGREGGLPPSPYVLLFGPMCCFCYQGSGIRVYTAPSPLGPYTDQGEDIACSSSTPSEGQAAAAAGGGGPEPTPQQGCLFYSTTTGAAAPLVSTTRAQQNYVIEVLTVGGGLEYVWTGDRWGQAHDGLKGHEPQFWAPLRFMSTGGLERVEWVDSFTIDVHVGQREGVHMGR